MLNKVILIGRITKKPELKQTTTGLSVTSFSIAVNRNYVSNDGTREVDFLNIVAWRKTAENVAKFTDKGSLISVEGNIRTRSYDANDGSKRYVTEIYADQITFLESKNKQQSAPQQEFNNVKEEKQQNLFEEEFDFEDDFEITEEDIPF